MFVINTLDLATMGNFPTVLHLVRRHDRIVLEKGWDQGELIVPTLFPKLAFHYDGFELGPSETGIEVAVKKADTTYQEFLDGVWQPNPLPTFYTPEQIRQRLEKWAGPMQFHLRLHRLPNGTSPALETLKLGYFAPGGVCDYLMQFTVPQKLGVLVSFSRNVRPSPDGMAVPIPLGFKPEKIQNAIVFVPGQTPQVGTPAVMTDGNWKIGVPAPLQVGLTTRLVFDYSPTVIYARKEDLEFQVSEYPCIILRLTQGQDYAQLNTTNTIRLADGRIRTWRPTYVYNQAFEARIVAEEPEDVRAIGHCLTQSVKAAGILTMPGYGEYRGLQVLSGLSPDRTSDLIKGSLQSSRLRFLIRALTQGESIADSDGIQGIDSPVFAS